MYLDAAGPFSKCIFKNKNIYTKPTSLIEVGKSFPFATILFKLYGVSHIRNKQRSLSSNAISSQLA
jgi:hypothetical protein